MSFDGSIQKALEQLSDYGLIIDDVVTDGKLRRVKVDGDKGQKKSGWYVAHEFALDDGRTVVVGRYGNWKRSDEKLAFEADYQLSDNDKKALKEKRDADLKRVEAERKRAAGDAEKRANDLWDKCRDTGNNDYLKRKGVRGFFIGYMRDSLYIPVRTITGKLVGLQFISKDGDKKFLTGTAKHGAFHIIGDPDDSDKLIIVEGYATAASIYQATKIPCIIAFDAGNLLPVAAAWRRRKPDIEIVFAVDDDYLQLCRKCKQLTTVETDICMRCGEPHLQKNVGVVTGKYAASKVNGKVVIPKFIQQRPLDKKGLTDFNDMDIEQTLKAVRECIIDQIENPVEVLSTPEEASPEEDDLSEQGHEEPADAWLKRRLKNKDGNTTPVLANIYLFLSNMQEWQGVIAYDEFAGRVVCLKQPPFGGTGNRPWTDNDDRRTTVWVSTRCGFTPKDTEVLKAIELVAEDNSFHEVRDYLDGLTWDGNPRVETWLIDYLGALSVISKDADETEYDRREKLEQYLRAAGSKWLVSAIARIMQPGCKADHVLILEGLQGKGKSTTFDILAGNWFCDTLFNIGDKDALQMLGGKWIVELAELDGFNKSESSKSKGFFSTRIDTYRPPYGRRTMDFPRQCIFGGTTNEHEYLRDDVNRRYWPVDCKYIEFEQLKLDRDQIWAEALQMYNDGVKWWPLADEVELFTIEQNKRQINDPWFDEIEIWLGQPEKQDTPMGKYEITINGVLTQCLGQHVGAAGERHERIRIGKILYRLGWVKRQRSKGQDRYYYVRGRAHD